MSLPPRARTLAARAAAASLLTLALGCAHTDPDVSTLASSSDQIIWEAAQKAIQDHSWETARQYLKRIVEGFPQSEYGPAARLAATPHEAVGRLSGAKRSQVRVGDEVAARVLPN